MSCIDIEESSPNERQNERVVLFDASAEQRWVNQRPSSPWFRCSVDDLRPANTWLNYTLTLEETQQYCAEWVGKKLGLNRATTLAVSAPLRPTFTRRLLEITDLDCIQTAHLCIEVLGWDHFPNVQTGQIDRWVAYAGLSPEALLPRWVLDTEPENFRITRKVGDQLANAGIAIGLSIPQAFWYRFLEGDDWDRCATRWRIAPVLLSPAGGEGGDTSHRTEEYLRSIAPGALLLLAKARDSLRTEIETPGSENGARSAAEALLFAALEVRPLLKGRFQLNAPLDFTFGTSRAEGDLTAVDSRLVVEIDGYHHFRSPEDYRRDRRKDAMLQEHGWFVVRFLAEDIVSNLEGVIESIEHNLARRDAIQRSTLLI